MHWEHKNSLDDLYTIGYEWDYHNSPDDELYTKEACLGVSELSQWWFVYKVACIIVWEYQNSPDLYTKRHALGLSELPRCWFVYKRACIGVLELSNEYLYTTGHAWDHWDYQNPPDDELYTKEASMGVSELSQCWAVYNKACKIHFACARFIIRQPE